MQTVEFRMQNGKTAVAVKSILHFAFCILHSELASLTGFAPVISCTKEREN